MTVAFAHTSFYIGLLSPRDRWHLLAVEASEAHCGNIITTEYVLIEVGNYLCNFSRIGFVRFVQVLRAESRTRIFPSSRALFEQGLQLYAQRQDKGWSLTDCISFVVMRRQRVADALTCDRHFEQAGFHLLMQR